MSFDGSSSKRIIQLHPSNIDAWPDLTPKEGIALEHSFPRAQTSVYTRDL